MTWRDAGPLNVGVIGCGVIAYWIHLPLLQQMKGVRLVVASDPDRAARERAGRVSRAPIVERAEDVLSDKSVEAVVICAPTHIHADLAVAALQAGKHVFVEKPIATSAHDAERVMAAAHGTSLSAMVGFNRRRHPMFEQARRLIVNGELGSIRAVQSAFCEPMASDVMSVWRRNRDTGGGVLLDLASHHIDLVRWFLGDEVAAVDCSIASEATEHDVASLSLSMVKGASVQGFFSYRTGRSDYIEFVGEGGTLRIDRHEQNFTIRVSRRLGYGTRRRFVAPDFAVAAWQAQRIFRPSREPSYKRALAAFVNSTRGGAGRVASLSDGARSLDVILAAEASAHSRTRVRMQA